MPEVTPSQLASLLSQLQLPAADSHKGQNGKVLVIGGSELFHAASKWSLDIVSKFVDMVFYASVPSNNELVRVAKGEFWNGIVIDRDQVESYLGEADVVLIGPGMERTTETADLTNHLLRTYSTKKWVIDAGALQMIEPTLLNANCIVTPHQQEFLALYHRRVMALAVRQADGSYHGEFAGEQFDTAANWQEHDPIWFESALARGLAEYQTLTESEKTDLKSHLKHVSRLLGEATVLVKGQQDWVTQWQQSYDQSALAEIKGGNAGMTKGGTGDVLAGIVAGLYCSHPAFEAAVLASYANKLAGETLYQRVGPFFNASDLVIEVPVALWSAYHHNQLNK